MRANPRWLLAMRKHVAHLCDQHQITVHWTRRGAFAFTELEEINTPPIRGAVSYATALHEIGHILGRHQRSRRVMVRESWAWRWARSNALVWTPAMERSRRGAMEWYEPRAVKLDRERGPSFEEQVALLLKPGAAPPPAGAW